MTDEERQDIRDQLGVSSDRQADTRGMLARRIELVHEIRRLYASGLHCAEVAARVNMSRTACAAIRKGTQRRGLDTPGVFENGRWLVQLEEPRIILGRLRARARK